MLQKQYRMGGLNLKTNALNKSDSNCTDCDNVLLDKSGNLTKRDGTSFVNLAAGSKDLIYYASGDSTYSYSGTLKNVETDKIVFPQGNYPITGTISTLDYVEYNDILYYLDNSGDLPLFKFDGYMWSVAGMNTIDANVTAGAGGTGFARLAAYVIDLRGNVVWGDYVQLDLSTGSQSIDIVWDSLGTKANRHFNNYSRVSTTDILTDTNNTALIDNTFGHNYIASSFGNDYVRMIDSSGTWHVLKVLSVVNNTSVTLEIPVGVSIPVTAGVPLESRAFVRLFTSTNENFGYYSRDDSAFLFDMSKGDSAGTTPFQYLGQTAIILTGSSYLDIPMEELFDTSILRGLPPRCKYLTIYNESLVLANRIEADVVYSQQSSTLRQSIYWSNIQLLQGGTSIENFPPSNTINIGNSGEGEIRGISGSSSSLIIGKERQIYYLNGVFQDLSYRVWSALTENIGIVSSRSIIKALGGILFMSEKGIFFSANGSNPKEISDPIETLFTSNLYDLSKTKGVLDHINERLIFSLIGIGSVTNKLLVYDYYYKEWFLWSGVDFEDGIEVKPDGTTYFQGANNNTPTFGYIAKLNNTVYTDTYNTNNPASLVTKSVNSSYSTNWFNFQSPSTKSKLTKIILLSVYNSDFTVNIREQINWKDIDVLTISDIELGQSNPANDRKLYATKAYSNRLIIENSNKEQIAISGYELEYTQDQRSPKGLN